MPVAFGPSYCKCGKLKRMLQTPEGLWSFCPNRFWWNFRKHDKKTRHAYFPLTHITKSQRVSRQAKKQKRDYHGRFSK